MVGSSDNQFSSRRRDQDSPLGTPLECDEGEYAYAARLILQGIPSYKLLARQSANARIFVTTTNSHLVFDEGPKSAETSKNYIAFHKPNF
jgi:hypothetical protein